MTGRARWRWPDFDLTFTVPKSASVLWALARPERQRLVVEAHRTAVDDVLSFIEQRALFTRTGSQGCAQVPTSGMVAAAFDHWDTRTGDPNLHTHVVVANKVQGPDGRWAVDRLEGTAPCRGCVVRAVRRPGRRPPVRPAAGELGVAGSG